MSRDDMGRTSRSAPPAAPIGSSVAVFVTLVALVLGFLILRQVNADPATVAPGGDGVDTTTAPSSSGLPIVTAEPTTPSSEAMVYSGASVVVANCSSLNGVAGDLTLALSGLGWTTVTATNGTVKIATSKVLYNADDPAALPVAKSIATTLGGIEVEAAPAVLPAGEGTWPEGSAVLVMLGDDYAGRTIAEIQARPSALPVAVETTTSTTAAP